MAGQGLKADGSAGEAVSDLEDLVGYNLKRAYLTVQTDFRAALGEDGLSPRHFSALALVVGFPHITQSALARKLGIERSGLVAIVDDLERSAYLGRAPVPGDRRVQALVPTAAGEAAYGEALRKVRAHEACLLGDMTEEEQATLIRLLRQIRARDGEA